MYHLDFYRIFALLTANRLSMYGFLLFTIDFDRSSSSVVVHVQKRYKENAVVIFLGTSSRRKNCRSTKAVPTEHAFSKFSCCYFQIFCSYIRKILNRLIFQQRILDDSPAWIGVRLIKLTDNHLCFQLHYYTRSSQCINCSSKASNQQWLGPAGRELVI